MIFIKILPLGTPLVETYNYEAYPLAISSAHGNGYLPWLYNNYIQLNCHDDIVKDKELFLAFYDDQAINSPFIKKQFLLHSSFSMLRIDFFDFIRSYIDQEYYLYFQVDEYYVPNRYFYKKEHFVHDLLIYGYTDDSLLIYGYGSNNKLEKTSIFYDDFKNAFDANTLNKDENYWADKIHLLKYNNSGEYTFNLQLVKLLCEDYLKSENHFETYSRYRNKLTDTVYGLDVYKKIDEYLYHVKRHDNIFSDEYVDNRVFRIIKEHKDIMLSRLKYLSQEIELDNEIREYKQIAKLANNNHILAIMYNNNNKTEIIDTLIYNNKSIVLHEPEILQKFLNKIGKVTGE